MILDYLASKKISTKDLVVVSPDVGGVARARGLAKKLNDAPLAIVDKRRQGHNVSEVNIIFHVLRFMSISQFSYFHFFTSFRMLQQKTNGVTFWKKSSSSYKKLKKNGYCNIIVRLSTFKLLYHC